MPTFRYSAYSASGRPTAGTIEADTISDAATRLKKDGLYPRDLAPLDDDARGEAAGLFRRRAGLPGLALMTRRLATLIGCSVPVFEAITTLYEQERPGDLKKALGRVRERLTEGTGLAKALAAEDHIFSASYTSMVAAGEAGGALDVVLDRLADFLEDWQEVRGRVITALAYPLIMVLVGTVVMMFLLGFVVPKITVIFEQNKATLPLITLLLIKVSNLVSRGWWALLLLGAIAVVAYRKAVKNEAVCFKRDSLLLRLPLVGSMIRGLILTRFAKVLSLLLTSGIPVISALEITGEVVVNRKYREILRTVREELVEGGSLSSSLRASDLFPPMLVQMVSVGEKGGKLEAMLLKAGKACEKEFGAAMARLTALLEPLLVLAMGLAVGFVVIAVLLPIFQLNQLIK